MPLNPNAVLTFASYAVEHGGVRFHFVCANPGAGQASDYYVFVTDAEMATITSVATFGSLLLAKLKRQERADGIASKLDSLIGRTITLP